MFLEVAKTELIAAVVVHYGSPDPTLRLLASLNGMGRISTTILVAHSEIDLPEGLTAMTLKEPNRGYAAGINSGVRYLLENRSEIATVVAMNPDIEIDENVIERLLETHNGENAALTFPTIRESNLLLEGYSVSPYGTMRRVRELEILVQPILPPRRSGVRKQRDHAASVHRVRHFQAS